MSTWAPSLVADRRVTVSPVPASLRDRTDIESGPITRDAARDRRRDLRRSLAMPVRNAPQGARGTARPAPDGPQTVCCPSSGASVRSGAREGPHLQLRVLAGVGLLLGEDGAEPAEQEAERDGDDARGSSAGTSGSRRPGTSTSGSPETTGENSTRPTADDQTAVDRPQGALGGEPLPEQAVEDRRQVGGGGDREGQRDQAGHVEVAGEGAECDGDDADEDGGPAGRASSPPSRWPSPCG